MDIETINKYIELDNQIKNRIVQISNALRCVRNESISRFVPSNAKHRSDLDIRYANEFIENSVCDDVSHEVTQLYNRPILHWSSYCKSIR